MSPKRLQRTILILGAVGVAVMVLLPPWQQADGDFLGYAPLFSPPTYTIVFAQPSNGYVSGLPKFSKERAQLSSGRLITQLLLLVVVTGGAFSLVSTYKGHE